MSGSDRDKIVIQKQMFVTLPVVIIVLLACTLLTTTPAPATEPGLTPTTLESPSEDTGEANMIEPSATIKPSATFTPQSTATEFPVTKNSSPTPSTLANEQLISDVEPTVTIIELVQQPPPIQSPLPLVTASSTPVPQLPSTGGAEEPLISVFRANVEEADPGDTITLDWATSQAITVTLWKLTATGQLSNWWDVEADGSFDYDIDPNERTLTKFALHAGDAAGNIEMATASVTLRCTADWFFTNPPEICPTTTALSSNAAEQLFEYGLMIWVGGENRIYVLFDDGNSPKWNAYADQWQPGQPENDPTLEPPPGLVQPVRGFGKIWREQIGVRERLGWALTEEVAYGTVLQRTSYAKYNSTYMQARDGNIWHLEPERSGWEKMQ